MKILKGLYKGVELSTPDDDRVRPTVDHFKKHILRIFDELNPTVIWDLFAGSGGVGLEFLSAGAREVVFVEELSKAANCIKLNIAECHLKNAAAMKNQKTEVIVTDVLTFLKSSRPQPHLIFMDPPYGQGFIKRVLPLLPEKVFVLIEHVSEEKISGENTELVLQEIYGPKSLTGLKLSSSVGLKSN